MEKRTQIASEPVTLEHHAIDAMRIAVLFRPLLSRVHVNTEGRETFFVESAWGQRSAESGSGWSSHHLAGFRDAFWIRDEFLRVSDERSALHFLRDTGRLTEDDQQLSWTTFQRWQTFTQVMMLSLEDEDRSRAPLADQSYFAAALKLGGYEKNCFALAEPTFRDGDFTKRLFIMTGHAGHFVRPGRSSYQVEFVRKERGSHGFTAEGLHHEIESFKSSQSEAMENISTPADPVLVIRPNCTIDAIAAAVWTERQSGVSWGKCAACRNLFQKRAHSEKKTCSETCKERFKKRNYRIKKANVAALAAVV